MLIFISMFVYEKFLPCMKTHLFIFDSDFIQSG